jgi:hypothetical protein
MSSDESLPAEQRENGYKVGPGCPPKEYQFKAGESGNPDGPPEHRTNLWVWFTKYMNMTARERAKINRTKLTAAQETALKMVENAVQGKGCGSAKLARYIIDREEGRAPQHLVLDKGAELSDGECENIRRQMRQMLSQTVSPVGGHSQSQSEGRQTGGKGHDE